MMFEQVETDYGTVERFLDVELDVEQESAAEGHARQQAGQITAR